MQNNAAKLKLYIKKINYHWISVDVELCGLVTCILLYRMMTDTPSRNVIENVSTCILTLWLYVTHYDSAI